MIQLQFLNALLDSKDSSLLLINNLNEDLFSDYKDEYNFTVATDSHYLKKEEREIHKTFLNSKDGKGNREVDEFYASAYMMSAEEVHEYMDNYLSSEFVDGMMENTLVIAKRCKMYSLDCPQIVPKIQYEWIKRDYMALSNLRDHIGNRPQLQYYCNSDVEADKYLALLIAEGYQKLIGEYIDEYLDRLEEELDTFKAISEIFNLITFSFARRNISPLANVAKRSQRGGLEISVCRAMMQDGDLRKRFKTRRFRDGKILARNDLYREF